MDPLWEAFGSLRASLRDLSGAAGGHFASLGEDLWVPCAFFQLSPHFLPPPSQLSPHFVPTLSPLPPHFFLNFLLTFCSLSSNFLPTFFQLSPHALLTFSQLSRHFLLRRVSMFLYSNSDSLRFLGATPRILRPRPEFQRASRSQP